MRKKSVEKILREKHSNAYLSPEEMESTKNYVLALYQYEKAFNEPLEIPSYLKKDVEMLVKMGIAAYVQSPYNSNRMSLTPEGYDLAKRLSAKTQEKS
jgi:hypothetical protein